MVLTWMGEIMTEYGIGNGVSLIIFAGICSRLPQQLQQTVGLVNVGESTWFNAVSDIFVILVSIVLGRAGDPGRPQDPDPVREAHRRPRMVGGQTTYLPMRIAASGVIPIIFAVSMIQFPTTVAQFSKNPLVQEIGAYFSLNSTTGALMYFVLIIVFTYFYSAVTLRSRGRVGQHQKVRRVHPGDPPREAHDRLPDPHPGTPDAGRRDLPGTDRRRADFYLSIHRAADAVPDGTSLLIVVGVALDTMKQIEAYVLMRHYEGFMK